MTPGAVLTVVLTAMLLAAPLAAEGQPAGRTPRIGWLQPVVLPAALVEGFRQGLRELGYVEGKNILIEYRWAEGKVERLPELAGELVRLKVDVLVSGNTAALQALQRATTTVPIVMLGSGDPVGTGLIDSLGRPGGNITGTTTIATELSGKRLDLLTQVVPMLSRLALLTNPSNPISLVQLRDTEAAAQALGVSVQALSVRSPHELGSAFSAILKGRADALMVAIDSLLVAERKRIVDFATMNRLPTVFGLREFVEAGGLMFYGASFPEMYRRAAGYVDKTLKGARPADLAVEQPTGFELVVNLKTARTLGVAVPPSVLLQADHVIE